MDKIDELHLSLVDDDIAEIYRSTEHDMWSSGGPLKEQMVREFRRLSTEISALRQEMCNSHNCPNNGGNSQDGV